MESVTILQQVLAILSGALVGFSLGLIGGGDSVRFMRIGNMSHPEF